MQTKPAGFLLPVVFLLAGCMSPLQRDVYEGKVDVKTLTASQADHCRLISVEDCSCGRAHPVEICKSIFKTHALQFNGNAIVILSEERTEVHYKASAALYDCPTP